MQTAAQVSRLSSFVPAGRVASVLSLSFGFEPEEGDNSESDNAFVQRQSVFATGIPQPATHQHGIYFVHFESAHVTARRSRRTPFSFCSFFRTHSLQMDSKKSPLALLAQTCSQIGADPAAVKTPSGGAQPTTSERKKSESKGSPVLSVDNRSSEPAATKTKKTNNENNNRLTPTDRRSKSTSPKNPNRSSGPAPSASSGPLPAMDHQSTTTAGASTGLMSHHLLPHPSQQQQHPGASLHPSPHHLMMAAALAGQGSDSSSSASALSLANSYKSLMAAAGMVGGAPYGAPYPPHSPYAAHPSMAGGGYGPPHPSAVDFGAYASALSAAKSSSSGQNPFIPTAAAMMSGYLAGHPASAAYSAALQQAMQQQQQYGQAGRSNSAASKSECRDPYCTGCPANNNSAAGPAVHMVCTAGCGLAVQCDHLRVPISAQHLQQMIPPSSPGPPSPHNNRPYVCNWIVADNYCGKRFGSSDDLLQHLRTHTNLSAAASNSSSDVPTSGAFAHPSHPSSMMRAAYPTPPLSPLSAARYHPYGKSNPAAPQQQPFAFHPQHPGMAAAMAAMAATGPYGPPPPTSLFQHPALAPYYSHLSLFAQQQQQANQQSTSRQQQGVVVPSAAPSGGAAPP